MLGSFVAANGGLCGNGDISMISIAGAGEDDGSGGVVIISSLHIHEQPVLQGGLGSLTAPVAWAEKQRPSWSHQLRAIFGLVRSLSLQTGQRTPPTFGQCGNSGTNLQQD